MELPVAPQTYQPSADALVRAIKRVEILLARTGADQIDLEVATCFVNSNRPGVGMANFAAEVRMGQSGPDEVLNRIEAHFASAGTMCHQLLGNDTDWPGDLARHAEARGYRRSVGRVYLLRQYALPGSIRSDLQIIPARAAYRQLRPFFELASTEQHALDEAAAGDYAEAFIDHLDEPRQEMFLGRLDGEPVGVVSLVTLGQIGVIENVYTVPEARSQGVATTLLAHSLDHCQRALFEQVILKVNDDNHDAIRLYESIGFKPAASFVGYHRIAS